MGLVPRISPASRLVIGTMAIALLLTAIAGNDRVPIVATASSAVPTASAAVPTETVTSAPIPTIANSHPPSPPAATGTPQPVSTSGEGSLAGLFALLRIEPEDREGYERSLFKHWIDADGDGCDTRREVLIAEAVVAPIVGSGCSLSGGQWLSPYDGRTFTDPSGLDIDHVVPLAEAWDSGAFSWTADRRMRFANDLDVPWALVAVSASSNRSKGDRDPAAWMPPLDSFACTYVAWWVEAKVRWSLSIDAVEQDELVHLVADCQATPVSIVLAP